MTRYEITIRDEKGRFWLYAPYEEKAREMAKRVLPKTPFDKIEAKAAGH